MTFKAAPPFRPAMLLRSGHAQTLAGVFLPKGPAPDPTLTQRHVITLADGDAVVLHEDRPAGWQAGDRTAVLVHGLAGSFQSGYMERTSARLNEAGLTTFRFDMRGCGAAYSLARHPAHSGRVSDLLAAIATITKLCPGSPISVFGFSLGGNVVLNTLAEIGSAADFPIEMAITVCPPIDLVSCSGSLKSGRLRLYDRHFISALLQTLADRAKQFPDATPVVLAKKPTSLWDFDHAVTAPLCGFASAEDYYRATSPAPRLTKIRVPTLIVSAKNDPLVPQAMFSTAQLGPAVSLQMVSGGGHLGFISNGQQDPDCRWLDWRLVEWTLAHQKQSRRAPATQAS